MYFDNRLLTYERTLTLELRMPNLHGLRYAAEIIAGSVLYPGKYELHTGMRGVIASDTVWHSRFIMGDMGNGGPQANSVL